MVGMVRGARPIHHTTYGDVQPTWHDHEIPELSTVQLVGQSG
jgi:hypothetical protein